MVGRAIQLAAAFALLVGLLGVSTALIAEVREEVVKAVETEPEFEVQPPDTGGEGLPIDGFTLLDPAPAHIPQREVAGNVVRLTGNGTLSLDAGDRIQVNEIPLPDDATVHLPAGGQYGDRVLECTTGCIVEGGERSLPAPPNASIVLPRGTGLPTSKGPVDRGTSFDLPPGARLFLAPITMPEPTTLPLSPGASIILPPGTAERASGSEPRVELPRDTIVRGGDNGTLEEGGVEKLLDQGTPTSPTQPPDARDPPAKPNIEVTEVPETIEKGRPFEVRGFVDTPNGTPSTDHPITIFANASKEKPGFRIQLGQVRTGSDGTFAATARINTSKPTQPYHIVARSHPVLDADPPMLEAWSDPVVGVESQSRLTLDVPEREGIRVPVALRGQLQDEHGAPIPGQEIRFQIEGTGQDLHATTNDDGEALVVAKEGFPHEGTWTVAATFDGSEHIDPAQARAQVEAVNARIVTNPTLVVPRGTNATLPGEVIVNASGAEDVQVVATYANLRSETTTGPDGRFELGFRVPASLEPGNYTMQLETGGITAERSVVLTVTGQTRIHTEPPSALPLGGTLPLHVTVTTERGGPIPGAPVTAEAPTGAAARASTDAEGQAVLPVSLSSNGDWSLTLSTPGTSLLASTTTEVPLHVAPLEVTGTASAVPGSTRNVTLHLSAGEEPMTEEPVRLDAETFEARGLTDGSGAAHLTLAAPPGTPAGQREVDLVLPRYNVVERIPMTVLDRPRLDVEVLEEGRDGDPIRVRVAAEGEQGRLAGLPLEIRAEGPFQALENTVTGSDGTVVAELDRPRGAQGVTVLTVRAQETERTGPAVEVASAEVTPAPFPWWTVLAGIPLAVAGVGLWLRSRESSTSTPPPGPQLDLYVEHDGEAWPMVWHEGEPATVRVELLDRDGRPIGGASVTVETPAKTHTVELDPRGRARIQIAPPGQGPFPVVAWFEGDRTHKSVETETELRLVDYREEIDREYRELRSASARTGLCGTDATPRELARGLGEAAPARQLVRLFERCDYSPRPVERTHYERFMRYKEDILADGPLSDG